MTERSCASLPITAQIQDNAAAPDPQTTDDPPPLSLYVHIPWCRRKCPYCDFNSYRHTGRIQEAEYLEALLCDLTAELAWQPEPRPLSSVFIGGGTPSLLSGTAITQLLQGIGDLLAIEPAAEITLESNPGTVETRRLAAYRAAGVNRLSIGAQSFAPPQLRRLGRIHSVADIHAAVRGARSAGFANVNLDLMYGLPHQDLATASADVDAAIALEPDHISYYQLTLEPDTPFHREPPPLPDDERLADMHAVAVERLATAGFTQYETSAFARPGLRCRHNLNYWTFGDYIGIGAGAHGKRTVGPPLLVSRSVKYARPEDYLAARARGLFTAERHSVREPELITEWMMNALRLTEGFPKALFRQRTGLPFACIAPQAMRAERAGLLALDEEWVRPTPLGQRFLDDLLLAFTGCDAA